ncbi:PREDICTED: DEAD-box ATP-dependent RNA helicase 46-like [Fragaria vesca subsp. vesca]
MAATSSASAGARNVQVIETATSAPVASKNGPSGSVSGHGGSLIRGSGPPDNGSAENYRRLHKITVIGDNVPLPSTTFKATGFTSDSLSEVQNAGFSAPTPIQAQSWPVAFEGRDIVAIAKPGSGKTLGYLLPGFMCLKRTHNNSQMGPTVLVLSPTGELAKQIQEEAMKFGKSLGIAVVVCTYGPF